MAFDLKVTQKSMSTFCLVIFTSDNPVQTNIILTNLKLRETRRRIKRLTFLQSSEHT